MTATVRPLPLTGSAIAARIWGGSEPNSNRERARERSSITRGESDSRAVRPKARSSTATPSTLSPRPITIWGSPETDRRTMRETRASVASRAPSSRGGIPCVRSRAAETSCPTRRRRERSSRRSLSLVRIFSNTLARLEISSSPAQTIGCSKSPEAILSDALARSSSGRVSCLVITYVNMLTKPVSTTSHIRSGPASLIAWSSTTS